MSTTSDTIASALFNKNRSTVLGLLLGHPDEEFYLREILRATGGGGAVQRELRRLAAAGIIRRSRRGNQVYFCADPDCPIFPELKGLILKTFGMIDVLRNGLMPLADRIRVALVFGSMARAGGKASSDVDLLIVGQARLREVVATLTAAQETLRREINPTVYAAEEFRDKLKARHPFLKSVLSGARLFVIGSQDELDRLAEERLAGRTPAQSRGDQ